MTFFNTDKLRVAYERFYEPENQHRLARVYWPVVLSVTLILVFVSTGYGVLQFFMPPQPTLPNVSVRNASVGFSEEDLLHIVERLEARKAAFEALLAQ